MISACLCASVCSPGDSDRPDPRFLVSRYGNFILLKPPFEPGTYLLWLTPFLLLLAGGGAIYLNARRKAALSRRKN